MRTKTEQMEGMLAGGAVLVGDDTDAIISQTLVILTICPKSEFEDSSVLVGSSVGAGMEKYDTGILISYRMSGTASQLSDVVGAIYDHTTHFFQQQRDFLSRHTMFNVYNLYNVEVVHKTNINAFL